MYHELYIHLYMLYTDSHHINLGYQLETWVILGNENQHFKSLFDLNTGFRSRHLNVAPHTGHHARLSEVRSIHLLFPTQQRPLSLPFFLVIHKEPSTIWAGSHNPRRERTGSRHLLPFESVLFQCELYLMKIQEKSCLSGTRQSPHPQVATFTCRNISGISYMYVVPKDCAWNLLDWSRSLVTYGVLINIPCNGPCLSPYAWNMIWKKKRMAWGIKRQEGKKKSHELPKVTFFHKCYFLKHIFGELNS